MNLKDKRLPGTLLLLLLLQSCHFVPCLGVPTIGHGPEDHTVGLGETVRLNCQVSDKTDDYLVAWIADGVRITRSNNESIDSSHVDTLRYSLIGRWADGDYTLEIRDIKSRDEGSYWCAVFSRDGSRVEISRKADLHVEYPPDLSSFRCTPSDVSELRVGHTTIIRCQSDNGNPPATLKWFLDSEIVNASEVHYPTYTSLTITKTVGLEDNGKVYHCKLTHSLLDQPQFCQVGPLNVIYKPMDIEITADSKGVFPSDGVDHAIVDVNAAVIFRCAASANPGAEYTWTITEAHGCSKGTTHTSTRDVLFISRTTMAYNGATITCTANNTIDKVSTFITLSVMSDDPNALCYTTTSAPATLRPTANTPTKDFGKSESQLTSLHIIIIVIAVAFLIVIIILAYIALSRRRETPIQLHVTGGAEDTRSLSEASIIFHSRHNTPDPELRGNSLGRMHSNFSTMSYDTQSIDSATALMHLKSLESPEYKANPKLTGSPTRKLKGKEYGKEFGKEFGKECGGGGSYAKECHMNEMERSPMHRINVVENTYEHSPKRNKPPSPTPCEKSGLTRQPSEHKYEECPPLKKYTTHASQTDLTIMGAAPDEREEIQDFSDSDDNDDFDYDPPKQNFSVNNCNIRYAHGMMCGKHTEV